MCGEKQWKHEGEVQDSPSVQVFNDAEWGLTRTIGFSFQDVLSQMSAAAAAAAQNPSVFVFSLLTPFGFMRVGGLVIYAFCVCTGGRLFYFPGIIMYYQLFTHQSQWLSWDDRSRGMTQTHTARKPAWPDPGRGETGSVWWRREGMQREAKLKISVMLGLLRRLNGHLWSCTHRLAQLPPLVSSSIETSFSLFGSVSPAHTFFI